MYVCYFDFAIVDCNSHFDENIVDFLSLPTEMTVNQMNMPSTAELDAEAEADAKAKSDVEATAEVIEEQVQIEWETGTSQFTRLYYTRQARVWE